MTVAEYIAQFLDSRGVSHVFDLSGGMIAHLLDAIHIRGRPEIVSLHHEQSGAFAADAAGRITGVPGVSLATAGPGATNLLTGIASCHFDSSPAVFITGAVNRRERRGDRRIRQLGFQETDIVEMARPVTKAAWLVNEVGEVPELLERGFETALSGRPGPVLIDIPMDIQYAELEATPAAAAPIDEGSNGLGEADLSELFDRVERAERPLLWVGGGVRAGRATAALRELLERTRVPAVVSLLGFDALPWSDPLRVGFIGTYGNRWANMAVGRSDLILVLGARLDIRQTGADTESFAAGREIFHVDCEADEINNRIKGCHAFEADIGDFLAAANETASAREFETRASWLTEIDELRDRYPDVDEARPPSGINPNVLMHQLSRASKDAAAYVVDVGLQQMWAAQSLELADGQLMLTSGGLGSMGFSLPAGIAAALLLAPRPVALIAGDGGFQCNIQELQTVVRTGLPLKMMIVNNHCHGMTRQFQQSYFGERYRSSLWGYSSPDFARVAEAYGIPGRSVEDEGEVADAIEWLWSDPGSPALLEVGIDSFTNAYPKIAFGRPIDEMEPLATPEPEWTAPEAAVPEAT